MKTELMEKKCLWLEFEEMKREVDELKQEKKRCREEMDVRCASCYGRVDIPLAVVLTS